MRELRTMALTLLALAACAGCSYDRPDIISVNLDSLSIDGEIMDGKYFHHRLHSILEKSDIDSLTKKYMLDGIVYNMKDYNAEEDVYGHKQTPKNFLFRDLNEDKVMDMVFQSNGSFIFDSHLFGFFLSKNDRYEFIAHSGQLVDLSFTEEYTSSLDNEMETYLKVDYYEYGCCDDPWDTYTTSLLRLNREWPEGRRMRVINLRSINRKAEETR